jgi:1-acyl-sn-glycerol-3-phosphate acyltransferase
MRPFWIFCLRLFRWKAVDPFPYHLKKCVVIVAPHTSNWDFVVGLAFRSYLRITHARFLGKSQLFRPPFGFFFRYLGGIPVDRSRKHQLADQLADMFAKEDELLLVLAPEGTRKKVDKLRTGFYHIAKKANVPIVMAGFDFAKKELRIAQPFLAGDDEAADFRHIYSFYTRIQGKFPQRSFAYKSPDAPDMYDSH